MQVNASSLSETRQLWNQRRQALSEMIGSIQSGNIAAAQKDLAHVHQANSSLGLTAAPAATNGAVPRNKIDFTALFSAVQSGDLNAAQDAWGAIEAAPTSTAAGAGPTPSATSIAAKISSLLTSVLGENTAAMQNGGTSVASQLEGLLDGKSSGQGNSASVSHIGSPRDQIADDVRDLAPAAQSGDVAAAQAARQRLLHHVNPFNAVAMAAPDQAQSNDLDGRLIAARLLP